MKKIKTLFAVILFACATDLSFAQTLNFKNLKKEDRHIATINIGLEYGLVYGAGYGYHLKSKLPLVLNAEFSLPTGENVFDDYKAKIGVQASIFQISNFYFIGKVQGIFRRNQNDFARLLNFGSDMSATAGYFKKKWFAAAEFGFDKAIVTHFKHSNSYKHVYPMVQDGWYDPATGGNFYFNLQAGYSFKNGDIYFKAGKTTTQNFSDNSLPYYGQMGYSFKFNQRQTHKRQTND